jgi:hypothetical protein
MKWFGTRAAWGGGPPSLLQECSEILEFSRAQRDFQAKQGAKNAAAGLLRPSLLSALHGAFLTVGLNSF